jgi:hypothetical protein
MRHEGHATAAKSGHAPIKACMSSRFLVRAPPQTQGLWPQPYNATHASMHAVITDHNEEG